MMRTRIPVAGALLLAFTLSLLAAGPENPATEAARTALQRLNGVIGEWRGIGQPRRGSAKGAWKQTSEFVWDFSGSEPAIRYVVADGKYVREGRITWDAPSSSYRMALQSPSGETQTFSGDWQKDELVFVSAESDETRSRLTLTPLNDKRTLVLHEKTSPGGQTFFRVAEVGYTREGTHLADPSGGPRECVVTGGTGTSTVTYQGKTYYVCCSGCRQAFEDDPEGIIADFQERLQKRKSGGK